MLGTMTVGPRKKSALSGFRHWELSKSTPFGLPTVMLSAGLMDADGQYLELGDGH